MFRKRDLKFTIGLLSGFIAVTVFALVAHTTEIHYFYASQGDLEVIVSADLTGPAEGTRPSIEWISCTDPSDGSALSWTGFGDSWDIRGIIISATNSGDLYVYEDEWVQIENPTEYTEWPEKCFKRGGTLPGGYRNPSVTGWTVDVAPCDSGDIPQVAIMPLDNSCNDDFWVFSMDVENCSNLCSLDLTFYLDCDVCEGEEYDIWELLSGDGSDCTWDPLEGVFEKKAAMVGYECTLSWEAASQDLDLCDLESKVFGVGTMSQSYILPEPGACNAGDIDGLGDWLLYLGKCDAQGTAILGSFDIAPKPNDGLPPGDVFYFTVELEEPGNICEIDLYLYLDEWDLDKSVWEFLDGEWEKMEGRFAWEVAGPLPWRVGDNEYECRLHIFYPPLLEGASILDEGYDEDAVFGVATDEYFQEDDSEESEGEVDDLMNTCGLGQYGRELLFLVFPMLLLLRKVC